MCIVLHKPAAIRLEPDIYENCWSTNRDGAGFAFAENGEIKIHKGFFECDELVKAIEPFADKDLVVHFRFATHGPTDKDNCHPWLVEGKKYSFAVAHNGILSVPSTDKLSDTGWFVENILGPQLKRDPWFLDTLGGIWLLEKAIGSFNKLVILRSDGRVYRINESAGTWDNDVWYSNDGFQPRMGLGFGYQQARRGMWPDDDYDSPNFPGATGSEAVARASSTSVGGCAVVPSPKVSATAASDEFAKRALEGGRGLLKLERVGDGHYQHRLNKRGRKTLKRLALDAFANEGMHMTNEELVKGLRTMARDTYGWMSSLPDDELDREIVKMGFRGAV